MDLFFLKRPGFTIKFKNEYKPCSRVGNTCRILTPLRSLFLAHSGFTQNINELKCIPGWVSLVEPSHHLVLFFWYTLVFFWILKNWKRVPGWDPLFRPTHLTAEKKRHAKNQGEWAVGGTEGGGRAAVGVSGTPRRSPYRTVAFLSVRERWFCPSARAYARGPCSLHLMGSSGGF